MKKKPLTINEVARMGANSTNKKHKDKKAEWGSKGGRTKWANYRKAQKKLRTGNALYSLASMLY